MIGQEVLVDSCSRMSKDPSSKRIVIFTGAGVSAESGINTFRDSGGLWEEHRIEDVATPQAWNRDPEYVLRFYDMRREQVLNASPNAAHFAIAELERHFDVHVITQNIDDLHERAGSSKVLHLHGEIRKARSSMDQDLIVPIEGNKLALGAKCSLGSQLRPHVVWFGEDVPELTRAAGIISQADVLVVVGTSLQVYPAAGLLHYAPEHCVVHAVDPAPLSGLPFEVEHHRMTAGEGVPRLAAKLLKRYGINE